MEEREDFKKGLKKVTSTIKSALKNPIKRGAIIAIAAFVAIIIFCGAAYDALVDAFSNRVSEHIKNNPVQYDTTDNSIMITDETVEGLVKVIEGMKINLEHLKLTKEDIKKLYAAEVVSSEINRGATEESGKYYGRVYIKRENPDTGVLEPLIYEPSLQKFEAMDASEILGYFSMDGDKICIANVITGTTENKVTINKLEYKDDIAQYTVPTEFLLDLCLITQNPGFVRAFADKIINETEIVIQVLQNKTEIQIDHIYTYEIEKATTSVGGHDREPKEKEVTTEKTTMVNSQIKVRSVKNWIMEVEQPYNKVVTGPTTVKSEVEKLEDDPKETEPEKNNHDRHPETKPRKINQEKYDETTTTITTFQEGVSEGVKDKVDEFIKMLKTPYSVHGTFIKESPIGKLESGAGMFFNMLRNGERTQSLEELMRYILEKATGNNYGVNNFDFNIFEIKGFTSIGASGGALSNYIKAWEDGDLWNYEMGKSATARHIVTQNGEDYCVVYEDGSAGHNNIGYGIATFISNKKNAQVTHPIYGDGYYNWVNQCSQYNIDVTTLKERRFDKKRRCFCYFCNCA